MIHRTSTIFASDILDETKAENRANSESIELEMVYAISPLSTSGHWSLNVNENIAGTTISTSNSITRPGSSKSSSSRGFQLHTYQISMNNIYQEVLIIFQSNSSRLIDEWYDLLSKRILRCEFNSTERTFSTAISLFSETTATYSDDPQSLCWSETHSTHLQHESQTDVRTGAVSTDLLR